MFLNLEYLINANQLQSKVDFIAILWSSTAIPGPPHKKNSLNVNSLLVAVVLACKETRQISMLNLFCSGSLTSSTCQYYGIQKLPAASGWTSVCHIHFCLCYSVDTFGDLPSEFCWPTSLLGKVNITTSFSQHGGICTCASCSDPIIDPLQPLYGV